MAGEGAHQDILGGTWSPIGWSVGWIEAPLTEVRTHLSRWRETLGQRVTVQDAPAPWPRCLESLLPIEAPWTVELIVSHGDGWTCYLNNDLNGGDPAASLGHMSRELDRLVVLSTHQPRTRVGHAATQFELIGPTGKPPLNYVRSISAHATDGRWRWDESDDPQRFEDLDRYRARLVRDRFPRVLLLEYLGAMGIEPDNRGWFGQATLIQQHVSWQRRQQTLARARRYWSLD